VAENLNVPRPERDPPHKLPEPVASNSTTKQLHDLPGDPTYHITHRNRSRIKPRILQMIRRVNCQVAYCGVDHRPIPRRSLGLCFALATQASPPRSALQIAASP
jgi:hypothetical protein